MVLLTAMWLAQPPAAWRAKAARDPLQHFFHQSFNSLTDEVASAKAILDRARDRQKVSALCAPARLRLP